MAESWRIQLLGGMEAVSGDRQISRFRTRKTAALLAYLAFYRHRSHPREELIELLWPECRPEQGRRSLRVALTSLRHQLERPGSPAGPVLRADRNSVQTDPTACITDVAQFETALDSAARAVDLSERMPRLTQAVELYQGALLPGYFEAWVLPERQRLADAYLHALDQLAASLEQTGDTHRALLYAWRVVLAEPLGEDGHRRLIRLLVAAGRPEVALRQYQDLCQRLKQEVGVSPAPDLQALVGELEEGAEYRGAAAVALTRVPTRLADLPETSALRPEIGTCLSPQTQRHWESPPVDVPFRPGSLPPSLTRFFGREEEIAELQRWLPEPQDPALWAHSGAEAGSPTGPRLVTLTGPGGTGKTRLALEVGRALRNRFHVAVWFVRLQELADSGLIPDELLRILGMARSPGQDPLDQICLFLSGRPSLLILDNYEHLAADGADVVRTLLERVPTLACLITSRQHLGIEGERVFPVAPLEVPGPAECEEHETKGGLSEVAALLANASVRLFVDRAQAVRPDFQVTPANAAAVRALCRRLEGLPLALELAAARSGVLTPQQMLGHLDRRFELLVRRGRTADMRHRSLWAALDWSYRLLSPDLQRFFRRLSVFRGGWTLQAAEAICGETRALEYLDELQAHSLVLAEAEGGEMRYRLLETVREFGQERLASAGETGPMRRQHRDWFLHRAEQAEPELRGPNQADWLNRLEAEHPNLRAALEWCKSTAGEIEAGLRLASALCPFWHVRQHWSERHQWLDDLLALAGPAADRAIQAKALVAASDARNRRPIERAIALASEGLALYRELGYEPGIAAALWELTAGTHTLWETAGGSVALHYARTIPLWEELLTRYRGLGDQVGMAATLWHLAWCAYFTNDAARARSLAEESRALCRRLGHKTGIVEVDDLLWCIDWREGRDDPARLAAEEGLALARELGYLQYVTEFLLQLGSVALRCGEHERAAALCEESAAVAQQVKMPFRVIWALAHQGRAALYLGRHEQAKRLCRRALALAQQSDGRNVAMPQCLEVLAGECVAQRPGRAAILLGAAEALRRSYNGSITWFDHPECAGILATARAALDQPVFDAAWDAGQAMAPGQAVAYALEESTSSEVDEWN